MPSPLSMIVRSRGEGYQTPRLQISSIGVAVLIVCIGVSVPLSAYLNNPVPAIVGIPIGLYCLFAIRVADQWQKAAVLRLGRGVFMIIPVIDEMSQYVEHPGLVTPVQAESELSRDTGP